MAGRSKLNESLMFLRLFKLPFRLVLLTAEEFESKVTVLLLNWTKGETSQRAFRLLRRNRICPTFGGDPVEFAVVVTGGELRRTFIVVAVVFGVEVVVKNIVKYLCL